MALQCNKSMDNEFGPAIHCRDFDFTLSFEQTILVTGPSSVFILLVAWRLTTLYGVSQKVKPLRYLYASKLLLAALVFALKILTLAQWAERPSTRYSISTTAVACTAYFGLLGLVAIEHTRLKRPSSVSSVYLLSQIVADSVILRTLQLRHYSPNIVKLTWVSLFAQLTLLVLESVSKRSQLIKAEPYGPEELAGILDRSVLWWLQGLLWRGHRKVLEQPDLLELSGSLRSGRLRDCIVSYWDENSNNKRRLHFTLFSVVWRPVLRILPARAAWIALSYSQTFLITAAIKFLETPSSKRAASHQYGLIGATGLIYIGIGVAEAATQAKRNRMVTIFRGSVVALIYEHALLYPSGADDLPAVTLMSADVDQLSNALMYASELFAIVTEIGIGIGLLRRQMGPVALAPIVLTLLSAWADTLLAKLQSKSRGVWLQAMQQRVGLTSAVLGSMRSVKLGGMTQVYATTLQDERVHEIRKAIKFRWLTVWQNTLASAPEALSGLLVFVVYAIEAKLGHREPLTTAKAYTSLALIALLTQPCSMLLQAISAVVSVGGNMVRLEEYLDRARTPREEVDRRPSTNGSVGTIVAVLIHSARHAESQTPMRVSSNIGLDRQTITMVTGAVGTGKSTLLRAMLAEATLPGVDTTAQASSMAYCSTTPWLLNASIKDNVIVDKDWDEQWFQTIIHVCDLGADLDLLPQRHLTLIGSRGTNLSGGQKHRVALARALYSRCTLLLLDDVLSALDGKTKSKVARRLRQHVRDHCLTAVFVSHDAELTGLADQVLTMYKTELMTLQPSQTRWPEESRRLECESEDTRSDPMTKEEAASPSDKPVEDKVESLKRQRGDLTIWSYYASSIGAAHCLILVFFAVIAMLAANFPRLWLKDTNRTRDAIGLFIAVYAVAALVEFAGSAAMIWEAMIKIASRSSLRLHQVLIDTTFNAPMSHFESTDNSVTLNRFSQDMMLIEAVLPIMVYLLVQSTVSCLMQLALVAMGSSYMAAIFPLLFVALYFVQKFYLRTSRQMRFLDLEAKSPLYQQFTETIEGIASIRASGYEDHFRKMFLRRLDDSQKPFYLLLCIQRWLGLVLNMLVAITATILMTLACTMTSSSSGSLGVALTSILALNAQLQNLISSWTQAETSLGSVARTRDFAANTQNEFELPASHLEKSDDTWPKGDIVVEDLTVTYRTDNLEHRALSHVSFVVKLGHHVGIRGRTGSGKSTLVSVLLRLLDPDNGSITIDDINISTIPRDIVRKRLICVPQDAFVLSGTFESMVTNSDFTDINDIQVVTSELGLWDLIAERGGLGARIASDTLSHGERQLMAIARAVFRNRRLQKRAILVLDEATSNLDEASAARALAFLRREFKNQTVISIAHRAEILDDCDVVIELEEGCVVNSNQALQ